MILTNIRVMPIPGPIAAKPIDKPAAITEEAEIIGFINSIKVKINTKD